MKKNLPVTKEDLKKSLAELVTKTDAKLFATKEDLKLFATKEDLKMMEKVIRTDVRLDFEDFRKEINEELDKRFSLMPTKDEFFNAMDKIMGELQTIREEHTISSHQLSNHEDRIVVLEKTAGIAAV